MIYSLIEKLSSQHANGGDNDTHKRPIRHQSASRFTRAQLLLLPQIHVGLHTLHGKAVAEEIADEGDKREYRRHTGKHTAAYYLISRRIGGVDQKRSDHTNRDIGKNRANAAEGGKRGSIVSLRAENRSHRAVGNIDGSIENASPDQVGNEHIRYFQPHRGVRQRALVHKKGSDRNGSAHAKQPRTEFSVLSSPADIHDPPHGYIGKGIQKTGKQEHSPHQFRGDAKNLCVKDQKKNSGEGEGKIVSHVPEKITDLIPPPEGTDVVFNSRSVVHLCDHLFCFTLRYYCHAIRFYTAK